jgi:hypothetical protein
VSFCLYTISHVLKTSVSAALSYSDFKVSILMLISTLNMMFCDNVSYVSIGPISSCHRQLLPLYNKCSMHLLLLLIAAFTVLVLLVSSVVRFLAPADKECKCAQNRSFCSDVHSLVFVIGRFIHSGVVEEYSFGI